MKNYLSILPILLISIHGYADQNTSAITTGAIVNSWVQAGIRETLQPFDLAVQGNGFFALHLSNGDQVYSRYGEMSLDADGFLHHNSSGGRVLGYCAGDLQEINLSGYAYDDQGAVVKSFKVGLGGTVTAVYESGYEHQTCTIALALFQNSTKLNRNKHVLKDTIDSGRALIGKPKTDGRGVIHSYSLEEVDEGIYQQNIKSDSVDRVAIEREKYRLASIDWEKQKTLFYVYELNVGRREFDDIERSAKKCEISIQKIRDQYEGSPVDLSIKDVKEKKIQNLLNQHESEIERIIGAERLNKAKKFRDAYNAKVWDKFGGIAFQFTVF